jgi:hypothetical protein
MVPLDRPIPQGQGEIHPQKVPEKNIEKQQMDSTPIADIMPSHVNGANEQDMMYAQAAPLPPQMQTHQQQQMQMQMRQPMMYEPTKGPFGMTHEQFQALFAGVCAMIAFCKPLQDKLVGSFPQLALDGDLTMIGLLVSGLIAAIIFYVGNKYVFKTM